MEDEDYSSNDSADEDFSFDPIYGDKKYILKKHFYQKKRLRQSIKYFKKI